jgi:hypothetical protein
MVLRVRDRRLWERALSGFIAAANRSEPLVAACRYMAIVGHRC